MAQRILLLIYFHLVFLIAITGIVPIKDAKNKKQTFDNSSASNAKVPNHEFDCYNHLSSINLKGKMQ